MTVLDRGAMGDLLAAHAREKQHFRKSIRAHARMAAGEQIIDHAHLRKQLAVLKGAGDAQARQFVRRQAGDVAAAKAYGALPAINAADAVEHAGLAGAIRPDQRQKLAALDRERDPIEHDQAAKAQLQILDRQFSHTICDCGDTA